MTLYCQNASKTPPEKEFFYNERIYRNQEAIGYLKPKYMKAPEKEFIIMGKHIETLYRQ